MSNEPTGTDDDLIPRSTVDAIRKHLTRTRLVRQKPHIPDSHTLRVAINVLKRQGCREALIAAMEDLRTRIEKLENKRSPAPEKPQ